MAPEALPPSDPDANLSLPGRGRRSQGGAERAAQNKLVDHILRKNADDIVDVNRAIGKFESAAREERHRMKMKGINKKGRADKAAAGGKKRTGGTKPGRK